MSEEQNAEIVQLKETIAQLRNRLKRSTSTIFEPGDELVWFDIGEVSTMGAHTHISGPRNYIIHQADGYASDQLYTVKRIDEDTSTTTIIGRDLPDWETAKAVAQSDFDDGELSIVAALIKAIEPKHRYLGPIDERCPRCGGPIETLLSTEGKHPLRCCWRCEAAQLERGNDE